MNNNAEKLWKHYTNDRIVILMVEVSGNYSNASLVTNGVPRGSILGQILFSIYTLPFIKCIEYCRSRFWGVEIPISYSVKKKWGPAGTFDMNLCKVLLSVDKTFLIQPKICS